ncbi:PPP4R2-domain-containing protein [Circinella umbellata]|nr:PPP4R2-domain-containing protein [Circinella umbellata]
MADDTIDEQVTTITPTPTPSSQTETQSLSDSGEKSPELQHPQRPLPDSIEIGDSLNDLEYYQGLSDIAETNQITHSWLDLQVAIKNAIVQQCEMIEKKEPTPEEWVNIEGIKTNILHSLELHERPPFTIQRLCELVLNPRKHYRMFIKYMNAIEKVLLVTSAWEDFAEHSGTNGVSGSSSTSDGLFTLEDSMINGVELEPITFESKDDDNDNDKNDDRDDGITTINVDDNINKSSDSDDSNDRNINNQSKNNNNNDNANESNANDHNMKNNSNDSYDKASNDNDVTEMDVDQ